MGKAGESFSLFSWQPFSPSGANGSDRFSAQLSEVLDGADHLAGIAVLVVVPGHDLHLIGVEAAKWLHIRVFASLNVGFLVRLCRKRLPYLATDCFQNYNESVSYSLE